MFWFGTRSIRVHSRAFAVDLNSYEIFTRFLWSRFDRGTWNVFELKCSDPLAQRVDSWRNHQVAPLANTRSRRRGRRPVQSRRLRSSDAKHVSRFAGGLQSPVKDDRK